MAQPVLYANSVNFLEVESPPQSNGPFAYITAHSVTGQQLGRYAYPEASYDITQDPPTLLGPFPMGLPGSITATTSGQVFVQETVITGPLETDLYKVGVRRFPSSLGNGVFEEFTDFPIVEGGSENEGFFVFLSFLGAFGGLFPLINDTKVLYWLGNGFLGDTALLSSYPFSGGNHIANFLNLDPEVGPVVLNYCFAKGYENLYASETFGSDNNVYFGPLAGPLETVAVTSGASAKTARSIAVDQTTGALYVLWSDSRTNPTSFTVEQYDESFNHTHTYTPSSSLVNVETPALEFLSLTAGGGKIFLTGGILNPDVDLFILDAIWVIDAATGAGSDDYLFSLSGAGPSNVTGHVTSGMCVGGGVAPPFRQRQRDDGLGSDNGPRVSVGANAPTSRQSSIRQGGNNTYW